jgi:thiol-disulfide isomerase/thioredoxin
LQYPVTGFALNTSRLAAIGCLFATMVALAGCSKIELDRNEGAPLVWSDLRGQWVLVNYWAEWCKPCLKEIPELNALSQNPSITVLGVNFDGISGAELRQLGVRMAIGFDLLNQDPGPQFGWQTPIALPATLVINPQGELQQVLFGEQTQASIRAAIGL